MVLLKRGYGIYYPGRQGRKLKITDKIRLDWLTENGDWFGHGGRIGIVFLPVELENGQDIRGAIDDAIRGDK